MAKPLDSSDFPTQFNISIFGGGSHHSGTGIQTRKSDPIRCEETLISCEHPEDNHKTRRVNPQRLAARLAPELVAEMEAYIIPGAKMPNFTVRKDFQERYCVDRRHIYDYFHSRGLRVAKEDKHTNLTRGRMSSTMSRRSPQQQSMPDTATKTDIYEDKKPKVQVGRSYPALPKILPRKRVNHLVPENPPVVKSRRRLGPSKTRTIGLSSSLSSPDISHSLADDEDSNYDAPGSPCPVFTLPEDYPDTPLLIEDSKISVYDSASELQDFYGIANDLSIHSESLLQDCLGHVDSFDSIEDHRPLTQYERQEFYDLINRSLPQSSGTAERSGTYSAYMEEQSRRYFDRLANNATPRYKRLNNLRPATGTSGEVVDFQKWLAVPTKHKLFKSNYGETPAFHDQLAWLPTSPETVDGVDLLVRNYLEPGVVDGVPERTQNKNTVSSTPNLCFGSRHSQHQIQNLGEDSSRTLDNFTGRNPITRMVESHGLNDRLTSARIPSYAIPGRSRTNSAGGGI